MPPRKIFITSTIVDLASIPVIDSRKCYGLSKLWTIMNIFDCFHMASWYIPKGLIQCISRTFKKELYLFNDFHANWPLSIPKLCCFTFLSFYWSDLLERSLICYSCLNNYISNFILNRLWKSEEIDILNFRMTTNSFHFFG